MKKLKSYSNVWSVEKVIYGVGDMKLPISLTFSQITRLVLSLLLMMLLKNVPPISMIESPLVKYLGIPVLLTWFMSTKTFDGKKPVGFLRSVIGYALRPKATYAGKAVKLRKAKNKPCITVVRSDMYNGISD